MSRPVADRLLDNITGLCGLVAASILLGIGLYLARESTFVLGEVPLNAFFTDNGWFPTQKPGLFGLLPMLIASFAVALGAVLLATPLAIGTALFLHEQAAPKVAAAFRQLLGLLAAIPSVIYGFWGLVVLVPLLNQYQPPGASLLAGILVLALMVLPLIALNADIAYAAVPHSYREAAAALGLSRVTTIGTILLPAARPGLITGLWLALARALGETLAVMMVCGNVIQVPQSLFDPVRTLTANIALEMAYALGNHRSALFFGGFLLLLAVAALRLTASALRREGP